MTAAAEMAAWTDCAAIGAILRARRGARGLRAVAAEIGTSHSSLSRLERGRLVEVTTLQRVHDWLQANDPAGQGPPSPSAPSAPRLKPEPGLLNLIVETFPPEKTVAAELPDAARHYLMQAFETLSAPDAAVLMAASAVDAMLKEKNLDEGSLDQRIDKAAELRILTPEMAQWAHSVRWESNRPRHADKSNPHLTVAEARQAVEFAEALGEVLFVLPARVSRGLVASQQRNGK